MKGHEVIVIVRVCKLQETGTILYFYGMTFVRT